ncbi:MAG: response regulator [Pseudomonadota bacterium]
MIKNRVDNVDVRNTFEFEKSVIKRRVLFVEQNTEATQKLLEILAEMPRYPVTTTVAPVDVIEQIQINQFDVVIIDNSTPQPPQWDVLHKLCDILRELPIIVLSGDESQGIKALRIGAKDYLIESEVNPRSLARTIRYTLEHSSVLRDLKRAKLQEESAKAQSAHLLDLSSQLKAPIHVLLGFTEVMHEGQLGSVGCAKYEDHIADTHKCATHLSSLLDNLLQASDAQTAQ